MGMFMAFSGRAPNLASRILLGLLNDDRAALRFSPADVLMRRRDLFLPKLSEQTLTNFEALFKRVNETLTKKAGPLNPAFEPRLR
jgi:hypothetical protein